jgi:ectoine hydroxylase-related dioxygenase (phytanoyl-CoA dioxygenase family)
MLNGMFKFFENITNSWKVPFKQNNPKTWESFYKLMPLHSMLIQHWGVGHAQVSWDIRQNPKIVEIYSKLHNCSNEELLVSFDGMSLNLPPEITDKGWNKNKTWYHTDQSYTRPHKECIQGWVTALDVNKFDATLAIMEGSHIYHEEFSKTFGITDKNDWFKLNKEQFYINKKCEYKKIKCPKGSLMLWDSRTIHCGVEPMNKKNIRAVIFQKNYVIKMI